MPYAKEMLSIGFTVAALPGTYITDEAVKHYGWEKQVQAGPDPAGSDPDENTKDSAAPKGRAQKGS